MQRILFCIVIAIAGLITCSLLYTQSEGQKMHKDTRNFFEKYGATELGTTKFISTNTIGLRGDWVTMLNLSVEDVGACGVNISIRTEYDSTNQTVGEPLVGLLQWGVGVGENQVEFDIPGARWSDYFAPNAGRGLGTGSMNNVPMNNVGGGVLIHLGGTSHISLYARNDGMMTPLVNPTGIGGPTHNIGRDNASTKVLAFVSPGYDSAYPPLERSIVVAGSNAGDPLVAAASVFVTVPPFAKSFRLERRPSSTPVLITFFNVGGIDVREVNLAINNEGPIPLSVQTDHIYITNQGAVDIDWLTAVFDVTP